MELPETTTFLKKKKKIMLGGAPGRIEKSSVTIFVSSGQS